MSSTDRDNQGRFVQGSSEASALGKVSKPHARRASQVRAAMLQAASPAKAAELMDVLYSIATESTHTPTERVAAVKEWFNRSVGSPIEIDVLAQIEELKGAVEQLSFQDSAF